MPKAKWTRPAREDLKSIALYIGRTDHRSIAAAKIAREIKTKCDDYVDTYTAGSEIGTTCPELGGNHRSLSHKRWVIIFRPSSDGIEVLRVVDAARDYPSLFADP